MRTVLKHLALDTWRARMEAQLDPLITAQLDLARGTMVMFARESINGERKGRFVRVTSAGEIETLLNGDDENGSDYYYVSTQDPDGRMLIDIMNRLTGKPRESLEVTGTDGGPIKIHHHYAADAAAR